MRYPIHKRYEMSEREMRGDGYRSTVIALSIALGAMVLCSMIPLALAGEHGGPTGYKTYCIKAPINCPRVERSEIQWSGIFEGHLLLVSAWASRMAHVTEPDDEDVYHMGNCLFGDCEDKALCMIEWLSGMGYPRGAFRMVKGRDENGDPHMWVAAFTTEGTFYFDDRQVAHESRWRGTAERIQSYDYYPPLGYAWNPVTSPSTGAYALMQDRTHD